MLKRPSQSHSLRQWLVSVWACDLILANEILVEVSLSASRRRYDSKDIDTKKTALFFLLNAFHAWM